MTPRIAVVLAAGGRGSRFSSPGENSAASRAETPAKQFIELAGYPIFVWSLRTLLSSPAVAEAVVVVPPDSVAPITHYLGQAPLDFEKPISVVRGGETRQASVHCGLKELERRGGADFVLIHDAARPMLTADIVERSIEGAIKYGAFSTAIEPADTVKEVEADHVSRTLDRDRLVLVQTPQGGRFDWLLAAHQRAADAAIATTDDAAILESAGHRVGIVRGAAFNVKVTRPEDLIIAGALITMLSEQRRL